MFGWGEFVDRSFDSEKVVCLLMADSKGKVFGVREVIDVVRFGDLEILLRVTAYVC